MRFSTILASASALLFTCSAYAQSNPIVNPTFSSGLDGWIVSDSSLVTAGSFNGLPAAGLGGSAAVATLSTRDIPTITLTQDVPGLAAGTNYVVTFSAAVSYSGNNPNGQNFALNLQINNGAVNEDYSVSGAYTMFTTSFTSIDGTDTLKFTVENGDYVIYITEVIVKPTATGSQAAKRKVRRDLAARLAEEQTLCPSSLVACPIVFGLVQGGSPSQVALASLDATNSEYECLDVQTELSSCGGCASVGQGIDCEALPFVGDVQCVMGSCLVYSCEQGYRPSSNMTMCEVKA